MLKIYQATRKPEKGYWMRIVLQLLWNQPRGAPEVHMANIERSPILATRRADADAGLPVRRSSLGVPMLAQLRFHGNSLKN
jgi:hypothetical protein